MTKRLHPSFIIIGAVSTLRALALPIIIAFFSGGRFSEYLSYLGIIGIMLIGIAYRAVEWWRLTYEVTPRELSVRSGVVSRQERTVPLERIQSVDFNENLLQRLFGVVRVKIESAAGGGAGSDVMLEAIGREEAADLRVRLMAVGRPGGAAGSGAEAEAATGTEAAVTMPTEPELILRLSPWRLIAAGATSGRVGPALGVLAFGFQVVNDAASTDLWERLARTDAELSLQGIVVLTIVLAAGAWLLAIGSMVLTFGGFELRRDGDRLLISHGLLERRRSTIPLRRVQAVTITEGILRQPFGLAAVRIESAGYGKDTAVSGVLTPLARVDELEGLLRRACPAYVVDLPRIEIARLPARARRRYIGAEIVQTSVTIGGFVLAAALIPRIPWEWGLAGLALLPFAAAMGLLRFRDAGWALDDNGRMIVRERRWERVTSVTDRRRLQHRSVHQNRLQRRVGLATFGAAVASGGAGGLVHLKHLDERVAHNLLLRLQPRPRTESPSGTPEPAIPISARG